MKTQTLLMTGILIGTFAPSVTGRAGDCSWTRKTPMPTARMCPSISVVNGKVCLFGGGRDIVGPHLPTVEEYDPGTDTWAGKTDMPTRRSASAASVVKGKVYVIGGETSAQAFVSTVQEYDPVTDRWTHRTDMPTKRSFLCAATVEDRIYAIGGRASGDPPDPGPSTLEVYDPATDRWTVNSPMPTRRAAAAACVVENKIYVIGGVAEDFHGTPLKAVHAYNPLTDTWTKQRDQPTARAFLSAVVLGGKIYAVGGGTWSGPTLTTVEVYDPATDTWTTGSRMITARAALAACTVNGKIYAIGGTQQWYPGQGLSIVEEYDPTPGVSLRREGATLSLTWRGVLQTTDALTDPVWEDLDPAPRCPCTIEPDPVQAMTFYHAREP